MTQFEPQPLFRVRVAGSQAALRHFLVEHPLELQRVARRDANVVADLFVTGEQRERLARLGLAVEVLYNATEVGERRRKEIGVDDRFSRGQLPTGLGKLLPKGER